MKNLVALFTLVFVLTGLSFYGQADYKWDIVTDSLEGDKSELYSKSKLFVGETWKSAQNVIQTDDKESGVILVKGASVQELYFQMNNHIWRFDYTVKLLMRDNKCKIIIEDVHCVSARCGGYNWAKMPVAESYPESKGLKLTGLNEKRYLEVMTSLKQELQYIADSYSEYLQKPNETNSDW